MNLLFQIFPLCLIILLTRHYWYKIFFPPTKFLIRIYPWRIIWKIKKVTISSTEKKISHTNYGFFCHRQHMTERPSQVPALIILRLSSADSPWIRKAYFLTLRTWLMACCVLRQCDSQKCVKPNKNLPHYEHSDSITLSLDTILSLFYTDLPLTVYLRSNPMLSSHLLLSPRKGCNSINFSPNFVLHFRSL